MNFKTIPLTAQPAYTWLWNTRITREGIRTQLKEMHASGIRAFYVIGEPESFRPEVRRTHLYPEYLSDEYLDLLFYAYETAREMGMCMWLYNEGGFPSGMVCGKIRQQHPELAMKTIEKEEFFIPAGTHHQAHERSLAVFTDEANAPAGQVHVVEYRWNDANSPYHAIRSDNASLRNTQIFLEMTHEKLAQRFGSHMGTDITMMFDDEAYMGPWTDGLDRLFLETYGYDMTEFLPFITGDKEPETLQEHQAVSDYIMLCGDLVRKNYFAPMKDWLRDHHMESTGHLDNDNKISGVRTNRYGNALATQREFDVPGIDVIWSQIDFPAQGSTPENAKCCPEGYEFFPLTASSAARQLGHSRCVSESFAVFGAHVTPELMRHNVGYQAVRGISLFNFMVISYDRATPMAHQYRPNFIAQNPGMDCLAQINEYTARLSHILQSGTASITTALYCPYRSICAGGKLGAQAAESFEHLGHMLEKQGVSFDLIDEEFVQRAHLHDTSLVGEHVTYDSVFVPNGALEPADVLEKLSHIPQTVNPCIQRKHPFLQARKLMFPDGSQGYLLCNTWNDTIEETIVLTSDKHACCVNLYDGTLQPLTYTHQGDRLIVPVSLRRGDCMFIYLTDQPQTVSVPVVLESVELTDIRAYISLHYKLDPEKGIVRTSYQPDEHPLTSSGWDPDFSGEVTYLCRLPELTGGFYRLRLGEVRHTAKIYIDDKQVGIATMPPYELPLGYLKGQEMLQLVVANTAANECARTPYFDSHDIRDVGPYHENMQKYESKAPAGGLTGPIILEHLDI